MYTLNHYKNHDKLGDSPDHRLKIFLIYSSEQITQFNGFSFFN
ncbi:hypothetical protein SAMN05421857_1135 [Chryseobacterium formosense]|nr:hypothetical protein SAMN05421857_1135 [Chryseobacterium formosense]